MNKCVCSTLTICTRSTLLKQKFFASIVDEAAQSLEPETLAGIINVRKTVLIGDIQQLQPTCLSTEAREAGFQKSMFERFMANTQIKRTMLKTQYRMHPAISEFSNKMFYSSKLENGYVSTKIKVANIDGFQGNEKEYIIFLVLGQTKLLVLDL
ncbi:Hypothetical protein KM1_258390 [Entamoeba histolytica HM-3:IMSS]|uniref:Uncharacterized protein n=1 Tax=Entamoeba histolytica HM-3:IMSS TaxID=885315 RepID=M7WJJ7_ENTHI|nr:Hypothetical protein KM1_258390 [Entamoeba histolytica HM-3:IMSS]